MKIKRTLNFLVNLGEELENKKYSFTFLLDLSGSMQGEPLNKVKFALNKVLTPLVAGGNNYSTADDIALFTFHSTVQKICPRVGSEDFDFFKEALFKLEDKIFSESGYTALFDGVVSSLKDIQKYSKEDYENILIVFSDGGENGSQHSKMNVDKHIKMMRNGFLDFKDYELKEEYQTYKKDFDKLFPIEYNNVNISKEKLNEKDFDFINDKERREKIFNKYSNSICNVRIYSLLYKADWASTRGEKLLNDFSSLSRGKVFKSPDVTSIPNVLKELVDDIVLGTSSSVRHKLISRLNESEIFDDETGEKIDDKWYRIISLNTCENNEQCDEKDKFYLRQYNKDNFSYPHSIYNFYLDKENQDSFNKKEIIKTLKEQYNKKLDRIVVDLKENFLYQNELMNNTGIETETNVFFTFFANDLLGHSLIEVFHNIMRNYLESGILGEARSYRFNLVLLIKKYPLYSENEKKLLKSLLIELGHLEHSLYEVFIITDNNDSSNNMYGYSQLNESDFEELIVENLYALNLNPELPDYLKGQIGAEYYSIGSVSLYVGVKNFIKRSALLFSKDFLRSLYNPDKIKVDEEDVQYSVDKFIEKIRISNYEKELLKGANVKTILELLDFPDEIRKFAYFSRQKLIHLYAKENPNNLYIEKELLYQNEFEFIRRVAFDLKNLMEISYSTVFFENRLDKNIFEEIEKIYSEIRNITDNKLFGNDRISSPLQAELWVTKAAEAIRNYIKTDFAEDLNKVKNKYNLQNFRYEAESGKVFTSPNPQTYFQKFVSKIKNFPLSSALRIKYFFTAFSLAVGIFATIIVLSLPIYFLILLILPILLYLWGEYKLLMGKRQLIELLEPYNESMKFTARNKAFEIFANKSQEFLEKIANKLVKDEENEEEPEPFLIEQLSEKEYLDYFKEANLKTLHQVLLVDSKAATESTAFHIDVTTTEHYTDNDETDISIKTSYGYPNKNEITEWEQYFRETLSIKGKFKYAIFPSVDILFNPLPLFSKLQDSIKYKINVLTIEEGKRYRITLLDELNSEESEELINLYDRGSWKIKINNLLQSYFELWQEIQNSNFFVLWRNVAFYEVWLSNLLKQVKYQHDFSDNKVDYIFKLWRRMYEARREYRKGIFTFAEKLWERMIKDKVDIWQIIEENSHKDKLFRYVKAFSYPAFRIYVSGDQPHYLKFYLSSDNNSIANLKNKHITSTIFNGQEIWQEFNISLSEYLLVFSGIMDLPIDQKEISFVLENLEPFFKDDKGKWKFTQEDHKFFNEDFIGKWLKNTKNLNKKIKYLSLGDRV